MEIKRINGVISAYGTGKVSAGKKISPSAPVKNTDRVEFGFQTALDAARKGIAQEVQSDASLQELAAARETAEGGVDANELVSFMLLG